MKIVALIPARAGSKRIPRKNIRPLAGHPLIAYTIAAARQSGAFADVLVCTDDHQDLNSIATIAALYEAQSIARPPAGDDEPDIVWVRQALTLFGGKFDAFAILRPTSPFRTAETINRAVAQFERQEVHSIRAVQPVKEHPGKMWQTEGVGHSMAPLIGIAWPPLGPGWHSLRTRDDQPWHSMPTQSLPQVYVQNASLEIAWSYVVKAFGTISGTKIAPFFTEGYEGVNLDTESDWQEAERLAAAHPELLPKVESYATHD